MKALKVLLVSSWGTKCGIAEYAGLLKESVEAADPDIQVWPSAETLDPAIGLPVAKGHHLEARCDMVHLNHHDALHSRWTWDHVRQLKEAGIPTLLTYHDTRERLDDCPKLASLHPICASTVVHEEVEGLRAIYWRQGIPPAAQGPMQLGLARYNGDGRANGVCFKHYHQQPVLGSVGFNFPWKNFDRLAEETGRAGWGLMLLAHDATIEDEARWLTLNPYACIIREFMSQDRVISHLAACDATAFMYTCANTGTSAAIRQGIAARKPVLAFAPCRQFRDLLQLDYTGDWDRGLIKTGIKWCDTWESFRHALQDVKPMTFDPWITALAHADSWTHLGRNYAQLYRVLVGERVEPGVAGSTM